MNKRIIIFDGLDRVGKTSVINSLQAKLKDNGKNPIVFHLTGPVSKVLNLETTFSGNSSQWEHLGTLTTQWLKFETVFNNIIDILNASENNVVILDRSPYSEPVWSRFFNRNTPDGNHNWSMLKKFLEVFKDLNDQILYISLIVNGEILLNRIYQSETDLNNYVNAFQTYTGSSAGPAKSKVLYSMNTVREDFLIVSTWLSKFKIKQVSYENNKEIDINNNAEAIFREITA